MTKGVQTRNQIIELTAPLFNTKGFDGTSMSDLCKATKLTKGALYGNFENKEELSLAAFQFSIKKVRLLCRDTIVGIPTNKEKLVALTEFFAQYVLNPPVKGGCPLLNSAIEADDNRKTMKKIVAFELEKTASFIAELLEKGKEDGEFRKDFKSRELALFFFCSIEGAIMFSRVSNSEEAMKATVKNITRILDSITK